MLLLHWLGMLEFFIHRHIRGLIRIVLISAIVWLSFKYVVLATGWAYDPVLKKTEKGILFNIREMVDAIAYSSLCMAMCVYAYVLSRNYRTVVKPRVRRTLLMVFLPLLSYLHTNG